jgi:hypothetical protein
MQKVKNQGSFGKIILQKLGKLYLPIGKVGK